ncbi:MAG: Lpg1974 family pore-forming outer membrane protein [Verrucomicrobiota bacterium]
MKKYTLTLLLTAAPLFAGTPAPVASAPQYNSEQGWILGVEPMALRPYQSEGRYNQNTYEFAGRGTIGYQFADGLAIKASYFGYGSDITPYAGASGRVSVSDIDLVVSQDFKPSEGFKLTPFVGLDWATFNEGYSTSSTATGTKFSGLGLVAGVDVTRALGNSFSLYGNAKESIVFGTTDENYTRSSQTSTDRVLFITQVGLGVQYDYCFSNVAANFRLGVEGQWYGGASNTDSENTGLAGFVLGANFRF